MNQLFKNLVLGTSPSLKEEKELSPALLKQIELIKLTSGSARPVKDFIWLIGEKQEEFRKFFMRVYIPSFPEFEKEGVTLKPCISTEKQCLYKLIPSNEERGIFRYLNKHFPGSYTGIELEIRFIDWDLEDVKEQGSQRLIDYFIKKEQSPLLKKEREGARRSHL